MLAAKILCNGAKALANYRFFLRSTPLFSASEGAVCGHFDQRIAPCLQSAAKQFTNTRRTRSSRFYNLPVLCRDR
jgi:hypothetical protein